MDSTMMGAVGQAASAPKSEAMKRGTEVFEGRVSIKEAENGGFILSADYRKESPKGSRGGPMMEYCPPKEFALNSFEDLVAQLRSLYGAAAPAAGEPAGGGYA